MDHKKVIKVNSEQLLSACAQLKFHCCFSSPRRSLPAACINPSILGFTPLYKLLGWLRWLMRESQTKQSNTFIRLSSWSRAPVQHCCWPWQPTLQKCLLSSWNNHPWHKQVKVKADVSSCIFFPVSGKSSAGSQKAAKLLDAYVQWWKPSRILKFTCAFRGLPQVRMRCALQTPRGNLSLCNDTKKLCLLSDMTHNSFLSTAYKSKAKTLHQEVTISTEIGKGEKCHREI